MADETEIPSANHTFLCSMNAMERKLITICCPITNFAEIFKMASKMAAENRKFNISDCMQTKQKFQVLSILFLWSRNAMETNLITIC